MDQADQLRKLVNKQKKVRTIPSQIVISKTESGSTLTVRT